MSRLEDFWLNSASAYYCEIVFFGQFQYSLRLFIGADSHDKVEFRKLLFSEKLFMRIDIEVFDIRENAFGSNTLS